MMINLGSGASPRSGYVNVDRVAVRGVDVVHDLDVAPWPFEDACASLLTAMDVFEHVDNAVLFMTECHRILMPRATLVLRTPHYRSMDAFTDPTHRRFPTEHTFDYWIPGTLLFKHNAFYGGVSFEQVSLFPDRGSMVVTLRKAPPSPDDHLSVAALPVVQRSPADAPPPVASAA